jgi:hypothetical protein
MLLAWPKDLLLKLVIAYVSTLDIQAWIRKTKASVVSIVGTDNRHGLFDQLVGTLRNGPGVSRPDRLANFPALSVSRFDSTQLWSGKTEAGPWSDFSSRR